MSALAPIFAMTCAETFGNVNFKRFAESGNSSHRHLAQGLAGYGCVMYFLVKSLSSSSMLYVGAMWEGMITIVGSLVAYFVLGERFNHWVQYLGLILAVLAIYLIHWGGNHKSI